MPVTITLRGIPAEARDELAARAARSGQSLGEYLRAELIAMANRPDLAALIARLHEESRDPEPPIS